MEISQWKLTLWWNRLKWDADVILFRTLTGYLNEDVEVIMTPRLPQWAEWRLWDEENLIQIPERKTGTSALVSEAAIEREELASKAENPNMHPAIFNHSLFFIKGNQKQWIKKAEFNNIEGKQQIVALISTTMRNTAHMVIRSCVRNRTLVHSLTSTYIV